MKQYAKIALLLIIILLINLLSPLWLGPFNIIKGVFFNIFFAFAFAYTTNPIATFLMKHKVPKILAKTITLIIFLSVFVIIGILILPLIINQLNQLSHLIYNSQGSISWIRQNEDFHRIYQLIEPYLDQISSFFLNTIGESIQDFLTSSTKFLSTSLIIFFLYIYMLFDYERIVNRFKTKLGYGTKAYSFFRELNYQFLQFIKSFVIILIITIIEYTIVFNLIGHPEWKTLAALVTLSNFIPYFGAIIVNLIALATAVFVSQELFFKVLVCVIVLPNIEGNILNPFVYKKTMKIDQLKTLISLLFLGGLFGIYGVIFTIPIVLFVQVYKRYYWEDTKRLLYHLWNVN
ncbi:MAG: AI-2E family transporter [Bacilli bacterium]